jgi:hypothetical protein
METIQWFVAIGVPVAGFLWSVYTGVHRRNTITYDLELQKRLTEQGQQDHAKLVQKRIDVMMRREYLPSPEFPIWHLILLFQGLAAMAAFVFLIFPNMIKWTWDGPSWTQVGFMLCMVPGMIVVFWWISWIGGLTAEELVRWNFARKRRDAGKSLHENPDEDEDKSDEAKGDSK